MNAAEVEKRRQLWTAMFRGVDAQTIAYVYNSMNSGTDYGGMGRPALREVWADNRASRWTNDRVFNVGLVELVERYLENPARRRFLMSRAASEGERPGNVRLRANLAALKRGGHV